MFPSSQPRSAMLLATLITFDFRQSDFDEFELGPRKPEFRRRRRLRWATV
jgi:hypothetical protein